MSFRFVVAKVSASFSEQNENEKLIQRNFQGFKIVQSDIRSSKNFYVRFFEILFENKVPTEASSLYHSFTKSNEMIH